MPVWLQVVFSLLLVAVVLWFMWRMKPRGDTLAGWSPWLALLSAWAGLLAMICAIVTWLAPRPDPWLALLFMGLTPAAMASGVLTLWLQRGQPIAGTPAESQRIQAYVGLTLGALAIIVGYAFVFTYRAPDQIL